MKTIPDVRLTFADRVGVWHRVFVLIPRRTFDNRVVWLRFAYRACYQTHSYLSYDAMSKFFVYALEKPESEGA